MDERNDHSFIFERLVTVSEKIERVAEKLDVIAGKIDRLQDSMIKLLEYASRQCNSQTQRNGTLELLYRIINLLLLSLLAVLGVKVFMSD